MTPTLFLLALFSITLNALAQIALRKTMLSLGEAGATHLDLPSILLTLSTNLWFVAGISCYLLSLGAWLAVLKKMEVSLAYPLLSIGYLIAALIGYFFMHENLNTTRIAGIAIICVGIIVISKSA